MKESLVLVGGGGHCCSWIDVIETQGRFDIVGIVDLPEKVGGEFFGYPIIGSDDRLPALVAGNNHFLVTLGQIGTPSHRIRIFNRLKSLGGRIVSIVSPTAHVSKRAKVGEGTVVLHHGVVNAGAVIGANCIVNTSALVEHEAEIADHCHISTSAVVNGGARVGEGCFLGSSSVVLNQIRIAPNCVVGAGSTVRKDLIESGIYAGMPLRKLNRP